MIYDNIRTICEKKNISIKQVERELGFSNSSICKWNECEPSVWKVQKVADYLGVSMEYCCQTRRRRAEVIDKIKFFLEDATIPIIGGIIGSFIGMGIAVLLGIL